MNTPNAGILKVVRIIKAGRVVELTDFLSSFFGDSDVDGAASRLLDAGEGTARDAGDEELFDDVIDEARGGVSGVGSDGEPVVPRSGRGR